LSSSADIYSLRSDEDNNKTLLSIQEAKAMKQRAKKLLAEARAMEAEISYTRASKARDRTNEIDEMIQELFANNTMAELTDKLKEERWSPEKLLPITERLHQRFRQTSGRSSAAANPGSFQIGDTSQSAEVNEQEKTKLALYITNLFKAAQVLDEESSRGVNPNSRWNGRAATMLESRLRELQREATLASKAEMEQNSTVTITGYIQQTMTDQEQVAAGVQIVQMPRWMPLVLALYLGDPSRPLEGRVESTDITIIRDKVLGPSKFYCASVESTAAAACFAGSFRDVPQDAPLNYTSIAFDEIQQYMNDTGLSQRLQLFLLQGSRRGLQGQLNIIAIPSSVAPAAPKAVLYSLRNILAIAAAVMTTLAYAVSCFALNPAFFDAVVNQDLVSPLLYLKCIPVFLGIVAIQAIHELAHRIAAWKQNVDLGPPVPLLSPQLGLFGCITPFRSFPADRDALFDVSTSGPLIGMLVSILCIVGGTWATLYSPMNVLSSFPHVPVGFFKGSFLTSYILQVLAPKVMIIPNSQPIPVHPALCVGFAGLVTNALNMLPISGLDGGWSLSAIIGRVPAVFASVGTLLTLTLTCVQDFSSLIFSFILIFGFSQVGRKPVLVQNQISPLNDTRVGIYLAAFTLSLLALIPFPGGQGLL
jgi:membrane-associated protease RseP (regulator of RpoE activity)